MIQGGKTAMDHIRIDFAAPTGTVKPMDGGVVAVDGRPEEVFDDPRNERLKAFLRAL